MCDCGHPFDATGSAAALAAGFEPHNVVHPPGPSKGAKFAVGLAGFLLGCLPLGVIAEFGVLVGPEDLDFIPRLLRGLAVILGLVGAGIALTVQKREHARRARRRVV